MQWIKSLEFRLGAFFASLSLLCAILVYTVPGLAMKAVSYLIHSDVPFTIRPFNIVEIITGIALWFVIGIIAGFMFKKICDCCKN